MQLKKQYLEVLFNFTEGTGGVLSLAESRTRDAFIKPLTDLTQSYLEDRNKIYVAFCLKDEDGNPALVDGNKYEFPKDKLDEINQELITLAEEEVSLETNDKLKEILEKSEYKPKVGEAEIIDEILNKI